MTSMMIRRFGAAVVGVAAMGAVAVLATSPATADAAPGVSPYAGTYIGSIRNSGGGGTEGYFPPYWDLTVTISSAGKISGVANFYNVFPENLWGAYTSPAGDGVASGSISSNGTLRLSVSDGKYHERIAGTFTVDTAGRIVCIDAGIGVALTPQ
jgi:hypothetical protein